MNELHGENQKLKDAYITATSEGKAQDNKLESLEQSFTEASSKLDETSSKLDEVKSSNEELQEEIKGLRKNKGNPMAASMQKNMIAALRE